MNTIDAELYILLFILLVAVAVAAAVEGVDNVSDLRHSLDEFEHREMAFFFVKFGVTGFSLKKPWYVLHSRTVIVILLEVTSVIKIWSASSVCRFHSSGGGEHVRIVFWWIKPIDGVFKGVAVLVEPADEGDGILLLTGVLLTTSELLSLAVDDELCREELREEDEELDEPEDAAAGALVLATLAALTVDVDVDVTADREGERETLGKADDDASFDLTTVGR